MVFSEDLFEVFGDDPFYGTGLWSGYPLCDLVTHREEYSDTRLIALFFAPPLVGFNFHPTEPRSYWAGGTVVCSMSMDLSVCVPGH